jgi:IclR family pca regulon transcriptional regulator
VFVAVLTGDHVTYIARAASERVVNISITIGGRAPAHAVSTGRVLLAAETQEAFHRYLDRVKLEKRTPNTLTSKVKLRSEIDRVRLEGYSIVDQELEIGLGSISVPIRDGQGRVLAALNVGCPSARRTVSDMKTLILPELTDAAQTITRGL